MKLIYPAIFTPCLEKEGYTVVVPDLPGCVSEGDSLVHAIEMGIDAACGWILGELEDGNSIPAATPYSAITPEDGGFVNLLVLDIDSYADRMIYMSDRELAIQLLNKVPEHKLGYVLAYIHGIIADEDADDTFCENLYQNYLHSEDPEDKETVSLSEAATLLVN